MLSQKVIYQNAVAGIVITREEAAAGHKHFLLLSNMLLASGPTFQDAARDALKVTGVLQLHQDAYHLEDVNAERNTESYHRGYQTGLTWIHSHTPGGPFHYRPQPHYTPAARPGRRLP